MSTLVDYQVFKMQEGLYLASLNEEELKIRVYIVPLHVYKKDEEYTVIFSIITSVETNKPKAGELCTPQNLLEYNGIPPKEIRKINSPKLVIRSENKTIILELELTDIRVYEKLRDASGAPCVNMSWISLQSIS